MNLSDTSIRWINSEPASNTSQTNKRVAEGSVPFNTAFAEQFKTFSLRQPSAESGKALPQPALEAEAGRIVLDEPGLNDILMSSRLSETLKSTRALEGLNHQHAPVLTNKTIVPGALNPVSAPEALETSARPEVPTVNSTPEILKTSARLEAPNVSSAPEMLKTSARPEALNVSSAPEVLNRSRASEMNQTFASTPSSTLRQKPHDGSDQKVTTSSIPAATAEINTSINEADLRQTALSSPAATIATVLTPQISAAPDAASPLAPTAALTTTPVTKAPETTAPIAPMAPMAPMAPVTTPQVTAAPEAASPLAPTAALTTTPVTKAPETTAPLAPMAPVTTPQVTGAPEAASPLAPTAALTTTPVTKAPETTAPIAPMAPVTTPAQIPATQAQRRFAYHAQNPVANKAEPITTEASDASLPRAEMVATTQTLSAKTAMGAPEIGTATRLANATKSAELSAVIEQPQPSTTIAPNTTKSVELSAMSERTETAIKTSTPVQISSVAIDLAVAQWTKARMNSQSDGRAELPEVAALSAPQDRAATEPLTLRTPRTETDTSALSQRFAEQLGQRLTREVTNTPWRAELELHPKSLGRIDIQLDFVNGQLEGHFQSNNALTRELLQEGLPKLRELLQQNGHTTVQLDVGSGSTNSNHERGSAQANSNGTEPKIRITQGDEAPDQQPMQTVTTDGFDLFV
jgi:flagellar hook-length control protein FliK